MKSDFLLVVDPPVINCSLWHRYPRMNDFPRLVFSLINLKSHLVHNFSQVLPHWKSHAFFSPPDLGRLL